jgi:hypothetical protein
MLVSPRSASQLANFVRPQNFNNVAVQENIAKINHSAFTPTTNCRKRIFNQEGAGADFQSEIHFCKANFAPARSAFTRLSLAPVYEALRTCELNQCVA